MRLIACLLAGLVLAAFALCCVGDAALTKLDESGIALIERVETMDDAARRVAQLAAGAR